MREACGYRLAKVDKREPGKYKNLPNEERNTNQAVHVCSRIGAGGPGKPEERFPPLWTTTDSFKAIMVLFSR